MIDIESLNLTEEELNQLQVQLNERKARQVYRDNLNKINENKKYIGKCYKEKDRNKYIYVLSSKSSNVFRFECMCFSFPVTFRENQRISRIFNPDDAFSTIEFDGIHVEDYPLLCYAYKSTSEKVLKVLNTLEEITEEEYFNKMYEYIDDLQTSIHNGKFNTTNQKPLI